MRPAQVRLSEFMRRARPRCFGDYEVCAAVDSTCGLARECYAEWRRRNPGVNPAHN